MIELQWSLVDANLDPVVGSEQRGSRPVLVVSNEEYNLSAANVTVLPLTSTKRRLYPCEVALTQGTGGIKLDSIVMAHQIRTISRLRLGKTIGSLDDEAIRDQVRAAVLEHLDLD